MKFRNAVYQGVSNFVIPDSTKMINESVHRTPQNCFLGVRFGQEINMSLTFNNILVYLPNKTIIELYKYIEWNCFS